MNSGFADRCLTTWLRRRKESQAIGPQGRSQGNPRPQSSSLTLTTASPLTPSLVAVTVASPLFCAVTTPESFTVATCVFELDQVTSRPVSVLPSASRRVAANVPPVGSRSRRRLSVDGLTVTDATGASCTVIAAAPVFPPDV